MKTDKAIVIRERTEIARSKADILPVEEGEIIDAQATDIVHRENFGSFMMAWNDSLHEAKYLENTKQTETSSASSETPPGAVKEADQSSCCVWLVILLVILLIAAYGMVAGHCVKWFDTGLQFCF